MAKYIVEIKEVHVNKVEVEAESPADARTKANDMLAEGLDGIDLEYSHTLEPEEWHVRLSVPEGDPHGWENWKGDSDGTVGAD